MENWSFHDISLSGEVVAKAQTAPTYNLPVPEMAWSNPLHLQSTTPDLNTTSPRHASFLYSRGVLARDVQRIQKVPSKTDATHLYPSKVSRLAMTEVQKEKIPTLYWTMKLLSTDTFVVPVLPTLITIDGDEPIAVNSQKRNEYIVPDGFPQPTKFSQCERKYMDLSTDCLREVARSWGFSSQI
ncbi:hypothetical protein V8E51_012557 [Hyaloscypha variabilis]